MSRLTYLNREWRLARRPITPEPRSQLFVFQSTHCPHSSITLSRDNLQTLAARRGYPGCAR